LRGRHLPLYLWKDIRLFMRLFSYLIILVGFFVFFSRGLAQLLHDRLCLLLFFILVIIFIGMIKFSCLSCAGLFLYRALYMRFSDIFCLWF